MLCVGIRSFFTAYTFSGSGLDGVRGVVEKAVTKELGAAALTTRYTCENSPLPTTSDLSKRLTSDSSTSPGPFPFCGVTLSRRSAKLEKSCRDWEVVGVAGGRTGLVVPPPSRGFDIDRELGSGGAIASPAASCGVWGDRC